MDTDLDKQNRQDALSAEPLPHNLTHQVEEEAREHTVASKGGAQERFRRGRVEAETHRISEEVTHQAQERTRRQKERVSLGQAAGYMDIPVRPYGAETLPAPRPLRRVLVPLRDSRTSERTLPYAELLASELQSQICLAYVEPGHAATTTRESWQVGAEDNRGPSMQKHVLSYFKSLCERIPESSSLISGLKIGAPSVAEGLLSVESANNMDLVLVALGSHSPANHMSLGKVIDTLIQKGSAPVMVIPPQAADTGHPVKVRHIVVPLDGSALAEQALAPLLGWLGQIRRDQDIRLAVTLLGVAESQAVHSHHLSYLESVRMELQSTPECEHIRVQAEVLLGSSVPEVLVDAVEQNIFGRTFRSEPTDLVIMATHGRGGLGRWLFGSVAGYVLPKVHVPVLLTHPAFLDS
jgi:nucleotide-binding universal stress UspA family protein